MRTNQTPKQIQPKIAKFLAGINAFSPSVSLYKTKKNAEATQLIIPAQMHPTLSLFIKITSSYYRGVFTL